MATTTLTNGTKIPERASRDWYSDLSTNWNLLDNHLGDTSSHLDDGLAPKATSDADGNTITSTYATKTELSTLSDVVDDKADDDSVVHIAGAETVTGAKTFSATVTSADVVPSATDTYSLGSASYQYNGIYGKTYYYNGTQWGLDQANTWTQNNTFTSYIKSIGEYRSDIWSSNARDNLYLMSRRDTEDVSGWLVNTFRANTDQGTAVHIYGWDLLENGNRYSGLRFVMGWESSLNNGSGGYRCRLLPNEQGTHPCTYFAIESLKSINGINPGALSLPKTTYDPIDTDGWDLTGNVSNPNSYTPVKDGWLCVIALAGTLTDAWLDIWEIFLWGQSVSQSPTGELFCMIPVRANSTVRIRVKASSIYYARFYPAEGNV